MKKAFLLLWLIVSSLFTSAQTECAAYPSSYSLAYMDSLIQTFGGGNTNPNAFVASVD